MAISKISLLPCFFSALLAVAAARGQAELKPAPPGPKPSKRAKAGLPHAPPSPKPFSEADYVQFALNLEYLEAEFYLTSVYGCGVECIDEALTGGGPNSTGRQKATLSPKMKELAKFLGLQEIDHIRFFREYLGAKAIPRPLVDLTTSFEKLAQLALGTSINFNPYVSEINWLIAAFVLPYVGLTAYVGTNPYLQTVAGKELLAGVLGVEAGQDAILRTALWFREHEVLEPNLEVYEVTGNITQERQKLSGAKRLTEKNIVVPVSLGPAGRTTVEILAANRNSLSFARNAEETLRLLYGNGDAHTPGGFFPNGLNGTIAHYFLTGEFNEKL